MSQDKPSDDGGTAEPVDDVALDDPVAEPDDPPADDGEDTDALPDDGLPGLFEGDGVAAAHPLRALQPFLVAPTVAQAFNTLSLDLVAVACVQVPDILFEFDSSFPSPSVAPMLQQIPVLQQQHTNARGQKPPLSVFGHADPVGNDDYNKQLSGRRAMAIFAALTHDKALWDFLMDHPHGGDNWQAKNVLATMRKAGGTPANASRADATQAYFDFLSPVVHDKGEFLGKGADGKGRADFQGCSEFNPLRLLSTGETATLPTAQRNSENAINRRVIVFMFRPGTTINTAKWPCPTALDGTAACRKRFFAPPNDGEQRRAAGAERREFAATQDTFACRFYDRIARLSPCELPVPPVLQSVSPLILFTPGALPVAAAPAKAPAAALAPAPAAAPAPGPAAPPVVADPQVTPARSVVLVKKAHTRPARVPVQLRTDKPFAGTGTFTVAPAGLLRFFRSATGGKPIAFNGVANGFTGKQLTAGVTLFAEGVKPSGSMDDITLTLTLNGGKKLIANNPKTARMTSVELFLDIHAMRTAAGADPAALSEAKKIRPGRAVHLQNAAKARRRALLTVREVKPKTFTGKLEVTASAATVRLMRNETKPAAPATDDVAALPLEVDPTKLPLKFFVEGAAVSTKARDTELRLGVKGIEPDGDHVVMTVIEAGLDLFQTRKEKDKPREKMSDADKLAVGRFVHVQDTTKPHKHRALMGLRQVKPADFVGTLVLTPLESLATPAVAAHCRVFTAEAAGVGSAVGMPHEVPHGAKFPSTGVRRFVEGGTVSTTLRDSGFRLGVKDVDDEVDRVALTVYQVEKVEMKVPLTRCRGAAVADATHTITTDSLTFDAATPVMIRSTGDIKLEATAKPPNLPLAWDVQHAADDHKDLTLLPPHVADGAVTKRKLTLNAFGSFHVFAFVDGNGNGLHSADEDGVAVNFHLVDVQVPAGAANNRIINNAAFSRTRFVATTLTVDSATSRGRFSVLPLINGQYGDAEFTKHLISFKTTLHLFGGGANKRRGLDKVHTGYNQTTTADSMVATFADGRTERETLFVTPIPPANLAPPPGGQVISDPAPPAPPLATLAFPVRDTRFNDPGVGAFIISSSDANAPDRKNLPGGGQQRVARMIDSPAIGFDLVHPVTGSALASIAGSNDFEVFLCALSTDFDASFSVLGRAAWSTTYGTFTAAGGWTNAGAALTAPAALAVIAPPVPGSTVPMERCPPNFVDSIPTDARN